MLLELKNIVAGYGSIMALKGISLSVREGSIVSLIGANGAGKSTTMRTIMGLVSLREGEIRFKGAPLSGTKPYQVVHEGISLVPEGRQILQNMSVEENLYLGAYQRSDKDGIAADLKKVYERFPRLEERKKQFGGTLSGGEQQMLAIGRAVMARPELLLLDEPSMGLAPIVVQEIFDVIKDINDSGTTILLVEQNARKALQIADYAYVMETGHIVLEGTAADVAANPQGTAAYLGGKKEYRHFAGVPVPEGEYHLFQHEKGFRTMSFGLMVRKPLFFCRKTGFIYPAHLRGRQPYQTGSQPCSFRCRLYHSGRQRPGR